MNTIAIRLLSQQLIRPQFSTAAEVVAHLGAVQAQDYRMVRWAVEMRTKRPSAADFRNAYDSGEIVRLHLMRGTWQLVAREDYRWMLALLAPRAEAVINGWMKSNGIAIDDRELHSVRGLLALTAEAKGSATASDFADALAAKGMEMDRHRLSYHIRMAELSGTLCSGDLSARSATYSPADRKVGPRPLVDRDEMLLLMARKYFRSHSPAAFEDYLWWSGLTAADCRRGMELLSGELHTETYKGYTLYIHDSCRTRGFRSGGALLLAPFDEYLIGYKSRDIVLSRENISKAHNTCGTFYPVIACDGVICGNWRPWAKTLETSFFDGYTAGTAALEAQWNLFKACL